MTDRPFKSVFETKLPHGFPRCASIGGGNLGIASAALINLMGGDCSLFIRGSKTGQVKLDEIAAHGSTVPIYVQSEGQDTPTKSVHIPLVTPDFAKAVRGRQLIFVTVPADGHEKIAQQLAPVLEPGTDIVLHPGQTLGALAFMDALRFHGADEGVLGQVAVSEYTTSVLTTRYEPWEGTDRNRARVSAIKTHMPMGTCPAARTGAAVELTQALFPNSEILAMESALASGLMALAAGPHLLITLLSMRSIESGFKSRYLYYLEGVTPSIAKLIHMFDAERVAIGEAMGVSTPTLLKSLQGMYASPADNLYDLFINNKEAYQGYYSPSSKWTRYFTEEMRTAVIPLLELRDLVEDGCRTAGQPVPEGLRPSLIESAANIVHAMFAGEDDFYSGARTLASMHLDGLTAAQIGEYAQTGSRPG